MTDNAMCIMVQDLNHLDTEDVILLTFLHSDLAACSMENVRGFDDCSWWLNVVCTAPCFKNSMLMFLWILTHYAVRNILFKATFFEVRQTK